MESTQPETREKRESLLLSEFERLLGILCTIDWKSGVAGLLQLLENELVVDKPDEFIELKKSIYYNVALIYKEKGQNLASLYFFMQMHKLSSPDNVSVLAEMGMLCRKEVRLPQGLYYFELALSLESSPTNRLLFAEQIMILRFCLDMEMNGILLNLRNCGYKVKEMAEFTEYISSGEFLPNSRDFLHPQFDWEISSHRRKIHSQYVQKIFELKEEWIKRRVSQAQEVPASELEAEAVEVIPVRLGKLKWKEFLSSLLVMHKIHNLYQKGLTDAEIRSKVESVTAYKWIGTIDLDLFESKFRIDIDEVVQPERKQPEDPELNFKKEDVQRTPRPSHTLISLSKIHFAAAFLSF